MKLFTSVDLAEYKPREFIEICGHPKSGKSYDVLSVASAVKRINSEATIYIIDTEDGLRKVWKTSFTDVDNIRLYLCADMDDVVLVIEKLKPLLKKDDWLCLESLS